MGLISYHLRNNFRYTCIVKVRNIFIFIYSTLSIHQAMLYDGLSSIFYFIYYHIYYIYNVFSITINPKSKVTLIRTHIFSAEPSLLVKSESWVNASRLSFFRKLSLQNIRECFIKKLLGEFK